MKTKVIEEKSEVAKSEVGSPKRSRKPKSKAETEVKGPREKQSTSQKRMPVLKVENQSD